MAIDPRTPAIFEVGQGGSQLRVRCHILSKRPRDEVISQTRLKAEEVLHKLPIIMARVRFQHADSISPNHGISTRELAMIDAKEPILYLFVPSTSDQIEVHVTLNDHLQYESSELIIL